MLDTYARKPHRRLRLALILVILLLAWSGGFLFSLVDDWRVQLNA